MKAYEMFNKVSAKVAAKTSTKPPKPGKPVATTNVETPTSQSTPTASVSVDDMKDTLGDQTRRLQFYEYLSTFEGNLNQLCKFYLLLKALENPNSNKKTNHDRMNQLLGNAYKMYERYGLGKHLSGKLNQELIEKLGKPAPTYHEGLFRQAQCEIEALLQKSYFPGFLKSTFYSSGGGGGQLDTAKHDVVPSFVHSDRDHSRMSNTSSRTLQLNRTLFQQQSTSSVGGASGNFARNRNTNLLNDSRASLRSLNPAILAATRTTTSSTAAVAAATTTTLMPPHPYRVPSQPMPSSCQDSERQSMVSVSTTTETAAEKSHRNRQQQHRTSRHRSSYGNTAASADDHIDPLIKKSIQANRNVNTGNLALDISLLSLNNNNNNNNMVNQPKASAVAAAVATAAAAAQQYVEMAEREHQDPASRAKRASHLRASLESWITHNGGQIVYDESRKTKLPILPLPNHLRHDLNDLPPTTTIHHHQQQQQQQQILHLSNRHHHHQHSLGKDVTGLVRDDTNENTTATAAQQQHQQVLLDPSFIYYQPTYKMKEVDIDSQNHQQLTSGVVAATTANAYNQQHHHHHDSGFSTGTKSIDSNERVTQWLDDKVGVTIVASSGGGGVNGGHQHQYTNSHHHNNHETTIKSAVGNKKPNHHQTSSSSKKQQEQQKQTQTQTQQQTSNSSSSSSSIKVAYQLPGEPTPYVSTFVGARPPTLLQFKELMIKRLPNCRYFFQAMSDLLGAETEIWQEVYDDNEIVPVCRGRVYAKLQERV